MKTLFLISLIAFSSFDCISQITFEKTYGSTNNEQGFELRQLEDSSFAIAGGTRSFGEPNGNFYLIKTDKYGDLLWEENYGGSEFDFCYAFENTPDGGYILAGTTASFGAGSGDHFIVKVDSIGTFEWQKFYGGAGFEKLNDVILSNDSSFYFLGITSSSGAGAEDAQVLKTNLNGDTLWTKTYGGALNDNATSLIQASDSNLLFVGWTNNYNASISSVLLNKIDPAGNLIWTKTYGGAFSDRGTHLIQTSDGGYMISGNTQSSTAGMFNKLYLIKTDNLGDTIWTRAYNNHNFTHGIHIEQTSDGGYIITGTEGISVFSPDLFLFKIDQNGNEEWNLIYGGYEMDYGLCVKQTFDEGYVVTGLNSSMGAGQQDVYLLKIDKTGNSTGLYPIEQNQFLEIYPNPTAGKISIKTENIEKIEIMNVHGGLVYVGIEKEIDIGSFPKGVYFINVLANGRMFTNKLVKQ
ncbi:MAG: hypothetical protein COA38_08895 [Fluviicola sp.]|nr:MAG: hypothetical protein COA38_08895 [Fluviicola sp.]